MTKQQDQIGKHGQNIAAATLAGLGIECLEKIGTPVKVIPVGKDHGRDVYRVIWGEKVSGDHHGILPNGIGVLIETKTILDRNLVWSDFREHQPDRLSKWSRYGLALVVWVHNTGIYVMQWPIEGFGPGKGINTHDAYYWDAVARQKISQRATFSIGS